MEPFVTSGLVIREADYGDYNKILTLLTEDHGKLSAIAYGARRPKSRKKAASQFLSYAQYTLMPSRDIYRIEECEPKKTFFSLTYDLEVLSYAAYFAELSGRFAPEGEDCGEILRLLMNSLYLLSEQKKDPRLVKAVFELRLLCTAGYMPDLTGCSSCGDLDGPFVFSLEDGGLLCRKCRKTGGLKPQLPVAGPVLEALRYVTGCEEKRAFSFQLSESPLHEFANVCERYTLSVFGEAIRALTYLKQVTLNKMDENGES